MRNESGQFLPGHSGNANGRPKSEFHIPDILRRIGDEPLSDLDKATRLEAICRVAFKQAIDGDRHAREWIANRIEGTPRQTIQMLNREPAKIRVIE